MHTAPPLFCFVGPSDVGKTTLLSKVIACLSGRGLRVGALKHASHHFEMDREGKDTWHFRAAGAAAIAIASPSARALITSVDAPVSLDDLARTLPPGLDIVLGEGWKSEGAPKIEVRRGGSAPLIDRQHVIAIASDHAVVAAEVPVFDLEDIEGLCDFLVARAGIRDGA